MSDESILNRLLTHLWASEERTQEQQVFVQKMAAHLLCLTERTSVWQSAEINKYISELTDSSPLLITAVPEGYGDAFVEVLKKMRFQSHIFLMLQGMKSVLLSEKLRVRVYLNTHVSNLKNIYLSLMQNKNEEITSFSLYPFHCLGSLKIPEVTDILWANIDDFILSVYIESDEVDRVPELLNSHEISMRVVEQIIAKMDFCIHQLDDIINRSESSGSNIYSILLQSGRILPSFNNFVHLLHDNAVNISGELVPWVNDKYAELEPSAIVINNTGVFDSFVSEFICSPELSEGALLKVLNNLNTVIIDVPEKCHCEMLSCYVQRRSWHRQLMSLRGYLMPSAEMSTMLTG